MNQFQLTVFSEDAAASDLVQDHVGGAHRKAALHSVETQRTMNVVYLSL